MDFEILLILNFLVFAVGQQPHIVFVFVDDLGWNDVGYHGSEIMTPTIDTLAADGVKLENYFVQPVCTPSRSQLLTGRYQIHTCVSSTPTGAVNIGGLPLEETVLPQKLQDVGYSTHMVGKWHLGYSSFDYTPTGRGFETFYGLYNGESDHFTHLHENPSAIAIDLNDNVGSTLEPVFDKDGVYSTNLFAERAVDVINDHDINQPMFLYLSFQTIHTPLQAPQEYIDMYPNITDENRQLTAAMMTCLDDALLNVTVALQEKGMWDNTVFVFSSDNGGGRGSDNSPQRGDKGSYFNGGIKVPGFVTSSLLSQTGVEYTGLVHVSDWMPTLVNLASGDVSDLELDGYDVWEAISENALGPRTEILHHIDPEIELKGQNRYPDIFDVRVQSAMTSLPWKIMTGQHNSGPENKNIFLFNIEADPYEENDLADESQAIVEELLLILATYNQTAVTPCEQERDPNGANPDNNGGAWMPWL